MSRVSSDQMPGSAGVPPACLCAGAWEVSMAVQPRIGTMNRQKIGPLNVRGASAPRLPRRRMLLSVGAPRPLPHSERSFRIAGSWKGATSSSWMHIDGMNRCSPMTNFRCICINSWHMLRDRFRPGSWVASTALRSRIGAMNRSRRREEADGARAASSASLPRRLRLVGSWKVRLGRRIACPGRSTRSAFGGGRDARAPRGSAR